MLKRIFLPALFVACALVLAACGGTDTSTNTNTATTTNTSKTSTTTTTNSPSSNTTSTTTTTTTTASADKIGVPECDDFIAKYDACVSSKVPEAQRATYKSTLDQWRSSWRTLAANPQTKASLAQACKTSIEQARTSMKSFGCDF